jgi:hypothetical protein
LLALTKISLPSASMAAMDSNAKRNSKTLDEGK